MEKKDSLDKERYSEYDGRPQRLKVRRESELHVPARMRLASTSSYPSSTSATSSRDSAMSSSRNSATQFSRRRTQEITQV